MDRQSAHLHEKVTDFLGNKCLICCQADLCVFLIRLSYICFISFLLLRLWRSCNISVFLSSTSLTQFYHLTAQMWKWELDEYLIMRRCMVGCDLIRLLYKTTRATNLAVSLVGSQKMRKYHMSVLYQCRIITELYCDRNKEGRIWLVLWCQKEMDRTGQDTFSY